MELKVLGSISPFCKNDKNGPGFLITDNDIKVLLDCGEGITKLLNFPSDLNNLNVFISHLHTDHYSGLLSIANASFVYNKLQGLEKSVKVYLPEIYKPRDWERDYPAEWNDYNLLKNVKKNYWKLIDYDTTSKIKLGGLEISFLKNYHDNLQSYSIKVCNKDFILVYTGDTGYSSVKELINFCKDADLLISESSLLLSDNIFNENHLHAYEAALIAKNANVKKLLLTHFWPDHNPQEYLDEAKMIYSKVDVAEEGNILRLEK